MARLASPFRSPRAETGLHGATAVAPWNQRAMSALAEGGGRGKAILIPTAAGKPLSFGRPDEFGWIFRAEYRFKDGATHVDVRSWPGSHGTTTPLRAAIRFEHARCRPVSRPHVLASSFRSSTRRSAPRSTLHDCRCDCIRDCHMRHSRVSAWSRAQTAIR